MKEFDFELLVGRHDLDLIVDVVDSISVVEHLSAHFQCLLNPYSSVVRRVVLSSSRSSPMSGFGAAHAAFLYYCQVSSRHWKFVNLSSLQRMLSIECLETLVLLV